MSIILILQVALIVFFSITLLMLLISIVANYFEKTPKLIARANQYEIWSENKRIGFLIGTLHAGFSESEILTLKDRYKDILPNANKFVFETSLPHWTGLQPGVEKILLEQIEKNNVDITGNVFGLEDLAFQQALINSLMQIGNFKIHIIWGRFLNIQPMLCILFNAYIRVFVSLIHMFCLICNKKLQPLIVERSKEEMNALRKNFLNGVTTDAKIIAYVVNHALIKQRDLRFAEKLANYFNEYQGDVFMVMIGTIHLAAEGGIIEQLAKKGYTLKAI